VHRIRLSDARRWDAELSGDANVVQLMWAADDLYVVTQIPVHTWRWTAESAALTSVCDCGPSPLGADASDRLIQPEVSEAASGELLPGTAQVPSADTKGGMALSELYDPVMPSPRLIVDPAGARSATITGHHADEGSDPRASPGGRFWLLIEGKGTPELRFRLTGPDPITDARVLGWADGGVIVRVRSLANAGLSSDNVSLRLFDPDTGGSRVISRAAERHVVPVAIAEDVVRSGVTVPGVRPQFSSSDRSHVKFLVVRGWWVFGAWIKALLVVLILGLLLALIRRHPHWMAAVRRGARSSAARLGRWRR
jgi:hypothetical protein